jgi:diguanylate cyclase
MDPLFLHLLHTQKLNRRILNSYWVLLFLSVVVETLSMYLSRTPHQVFLIHYVVLPTSLLVFILACTEVLMKMTERVQDYILMVSGNLIVSVFVAIHASVPSLRGAMLLPLLVSVCYFEKRKVLFAGVTTSLSYLLVYFVPAVHANTTPIDLVTMVAVNFGGILVAYTIMTRSAEIVDHLQKAYQQHTELMVRSTIIEVEAKKDALTGVYNQKSFHEHLEQVIHQSEQFNVQIALALFDIDNFKQLNDSFGHRVGDEVLKRVAHLIEEGVSANDFVARYGGEEFAVIFIDKFPEEVYFICEAIRQRISQLHMEELHGRSVTTSVGIEFYQPGQGKEALFENADAALYKAKRSGKNKVVAPRLAYDNEAGVSSRHLAKST